MRGRELRQCGDNKMRVADLPGAAARKEVLVFSSTADATPRSHEVRCVGVDEKNVTCVHLHHDVYKATELSF